MLEALTQLIVNADDFGRSSAINEAVVKAFQEGILTSASLMVSGEAVAEAVALAREHPRLGVGLHLTLTCGRAVSEPGELGGLVDGAGRLSMRPVRAGLRCFADRGMRGVLRREVLAQFEAFRRTGLTLDHVNGHQHFHLHPTVLGVLCDASTQLGLRSVRLTRDPLGMNLRLARGRLAYRVAHAAIFAGLGLWAAPRFRAMGWRSTDAVFGLLQDGRVDEAYVLALLGRLGAGCYELYAHPTLEAPRHELEALTSPRVKAAVERLGVRLRRYQDL